MKTQLFAFALTLLTLAAVGCAPAAEEEADDTEGAASTTTTSSKLVSGVYTGEDDAELTLVVDNTKGGSPWVSGRFVAPPEHGACRFTFAGRSGGAPAGTANAVVGATHGETVSLAWEKSTTGGRSSSSGLVVHLRRSFVRDDCRELFSKGVVDLRIAPSKKVDPAILSFQTVVVDKTAFHDQPDQATSMSIFATGGDAIEVLGVSEDKRWLRGRTTKPAEPRTGWLEAADFVLPSSYTGGGD